MRRVAFLAVVLALTPLLVAQAATSRVTVRTVTWHYASATNIAQQISPDPGNRACFIAGQSGSCFELQLARHETAVRVTSQDAAGQRVPLEYQFATGGSSKSLCGAGDINISGKRLLSIYTVVSNACTSVASYGTVTFRITGRK